MSALLSAASARFGENQNQKPRQVKPTFLLEDETPLANGREEATGDEQPQGEEQHLHEEERPQSLQAPSPLSEREIFLLMALAATVGALAIAVPVTVYCLSQRAHE